MKHESKVGEQEAGASRKNNKVSSEDDTNDTDAPLNSTYRPERLRTPECESKAVVVWAISLNPTDEWPLCEDCQEKDFGGLPENTTSPNHVQSEVHDDCITESSC
jgi:hypothetical protein